MKPCLKLSFVMSTLLGITAPLYTLAADAPAAKLTDPRVIMDKVYNLEDGNHSVMDMEMILIDKNGEQRTRQVKSYGRDAGADAAEGFSVSVDDEPFTVDFLILDGPGFIT